MSWSLFDEPLGWQVLPLPDADVRLHEGLDLGRAADSLMQALVEETPWRQDPIRVHGREYLQPRLHAWVGDAQAQYTYSGLHLTPQPWTPLLSDLRARLEAACDARFNSVLLNLYRNERDSMGMHADDEAELGPQPVIASLSLGQTRSLVFKHRWRDGLKPVHVPLPSGSVLLMAGATQTHWKHGIAKQSRALAPRLNLTFRWIHPAH